MTIFLASLPFICFFAFIFLFRRNFLISITSSLATLVLIGVLFWQIELFRMYSAGLKGFLMATEIIFIVFGALMIVEIIKNNNLLPVLRKFFLATCNDYRFQALLIAGAMVHFFEGVAGFGTPALLAIPILLTLGFKPLTAICISLIGDSAPVIFGAVGLPVTHGLNSILLSLETDPEIIITTINLIALFNIPLIALVLLIILIITVILEERPKNEIINFIPFTLIASLAISIPAFLTAYFLGPELPSIIGGFSGVLILIILGKNNILLPNNKISLIRDSISEKVPWQKIFKTLFPYIVVILLLMVSRLFLENFLKGLGGINIIEILDWPINYQFYFFYSTGFILFLATIISAVYFRNRPLDIWQIIKTVSKKISRAYLVLIIVLIFVQILIYSGDNLSKLPSLILVLASGLENIFGNYWILVASFLGAFGSFLAGSATVSNLLLTGFQYNTALGLNWPPALILTLQGLGAGAGNMIALHNIVAALVISNSDLKENIIIRKNLPIVFIYLLSITILTIIYIIFC